MEIETIFVLVGKIVCDERSVMSDESKHVHSRGELKTLHVLFLLAHRNLILPYSKGLLLETLPRRRRALANRILLSVRSLLVLAIFF